MQTAPTLLDALLSAAPAFTREAPRDARGLYGLIDHEGRLSYIGSTASRTQTLYERIHQRHRTGSETHSHYFSRMYNTGRMWRDREDGSTKADGDIAKALRNAFIAEHCRAVWVVLPDHLDIAGLEAEVLDIAPPRAVAWNRRAMAVYDEPVALVDRTLARLGLSARELAAIDRQRLRYGGTTGAEAPSRAPCPIRQGVPALPVGSFRFLALDVETANNDRSSICQIGLACVGPDGRIATWSSLVDPGTRDWTCSFVHGITAADVRGAPCFAEVLEAIDRLLKDRIVYQHSNFDRGAIEAACHANGLVAPSWNWQDSVHVARLAWPELKGNGGHGLASLKDYLGLDFRHHDAGEDARAAAEIVLLAEAGFRPERQAADPQAVVLPDDGELIEPFDAVDSAAVAAAAESPAMPCTPDEARADRFCMVPVAADGTWFHSGLARKGNFTIGPKGAELHSSSFAEALAALRLMDPPKWRRPNSAGNWGIVSGCGWKRLE